ncbi:hypothetical protein DVH05_008124 [Phytophthora capsici]|nr:hypothetical protein DVH05_008124 [Phytophthora capsici]
MYETSAKEQITKLEVEVKVANAQLREITYVNKDNVAQIDQLRKSLTLSEKETMVLKTRVEESQKHVEELQSERKNLERNQTELDVAKSTSKNTLNRFILALQNMLALVKMDEFPLDEAIRELLQLVQDTFGDELQLDHILDEDDQPVEIELQVHEDITDEERMSRQRRAAARRKGIINIENMDDEEESSETTEREVIRMSRCRKSKLDHLVNKLQREIAQKSEFIADLESVVVEQNRTISQLSTTTKQQTRVIFQFECQKGMLESDLETTTLMLFKARAEKQTVEFTLEQVRIDLVLQTNRAFQTEVTLATLRREFDMQGIVYEDLLATIWRQYEHDLYMRSLRREKAVQATVSLSDEGSQTLVPQRNPALERPRIASQYIPNDASGSSETLLQKISRATRELLPGVANEMDLHFTVGKLKRSPKQQNRQSLVRPLASSPRSSRTQLKAQVSTDESRRKHPGKYRSTREAEASTLPVLDDNTSGSSPSKGLIHHMNEFGTSQHVLVSPARPPFYKDPSNIELSRRPPAHESPRTRKVKPRKPNTDCHLVLDTQYEERVESVVPKARQTTRSPIHLPKPQQLSPTTSASTLRYNRSFLRAGMEVLRNTGSSENPLPYRGEESDDSSSLYESSDEDGPALSPSRLAAAVSGFNREQLSLQEAAWESQAFSEDGNKQDDTRTGTEIDGELATPDQLSSFTPAMLYPILPNQ